MGFLGDEYSECRYGVELGLEIVQDPGTYLEKNFPLQRSGQKEVA